MRGAPVENWSPVQTVEVSELAGRTVRLERLTSSHAPGLYLSVSECPDSDWDYFSYGPFKSEVEFSKHILAISQKADPFYFAILRNDFSHPVGYLSYQCISRIEGTVELAYIFFSRRLTNSIPATEAIYLLIRHAFGLGYRRVEWRCDSFNMKSRRAAQRLGFSFEGVFRQARVVKGRNRDTVWFSMIDKEWPQIRANYELWLNLSNFDDCGNQRQRLSVLNRPLLACLDPVLR